MHWDIVSVGAEKDSEKAFHGSDTMKEERRKIDTLKKINFVLILLT